MSTQTGAKKGKISTYFRGVKAETKKVIWPSKKDLVKYTGVVIFMCLIVGVVVYLLDLGIYQVLSLIIK